MVEKFCPVCTNKNELAAAFCIHCGAPLEPSPEGRPTTTSVDMDPKVVSEIAEKTFIESLEAPASGISLYLSGHSKPIYTLQEKQFVLGRRIRKEKEQGLVDLAPFGAFENGVSKQHALLRQAGNCYEIMDIGSTNGTWLNGQRLVPNRPYRLNSGMQIHLGRLCLYALYAKGSTES